MSLGHAGLTVMPLKSLVPTLAVAPGNVSLADCYVALVNSMFP